MALRFGMGASALALTRLLLNSQSLLSEAVLRSPADRLLGGRCAPLSLVGG